MSDNDTIVQVQFPLRKQTRTRLKNAGNNHDLHMGPMADVLLDYALSILESGKVPAALATAIEKASQEEADAES